jgi:hypothetical protein
MPQPLQLDRFLVNPYLGTIFTPTTHILASKVLSKVLAKFGDRFDGAPTVLPIPADANVEIPRIILQSADSQWVAEVSLVRVGIRWVQMQDGQQMSADDFSSVFTSFVEHLTQIQALRLGRLGFFKARYIFTHEPATLLSNFFCKDQVRAKIQAGLENFELHIHRKRKIAEKYDINEWVRFKTGLLAIPKTQQRKIAIVEQDINTLSEIANDVDLSVDDLRTFVKAGIIESDASFRAILGD